MGLKFSCTLYSGEFPNKKYDSIISKLNPSREEMLDALEYLNKHTGSANLKSVPEPDVGIIGLSVECDGKNIYLL